MNLREAKNIAEPYLEQPGTVTVAVEPSGVTAVYVGNSVSEMEAICSERNWTLFVIRDEDSKADKEEKMVQHLTEKTTKKKK